MEDAVAGELELVFLFVAADMMVECTIVQFEVHLLQSPVWMSHRRCVTRKMSRSNTAFGGESLNSLSFSPAS